MLSSHLGELEQLFFKVFRFGIREMQEVAFQMLFFHFSVEFDDFVNQAFPFSYITVPYSYLLIGVESRVMNPFSAVIVQSVEREKAVPERSCSCNAGLSTGIDQCSC